jgi:hypothetical protein
LHTYIILTIAPPAMAPIKTNIIVSILSSG